MMIRPFEPAPGGTVAFEVSVLVEAVHNANILRSPWTYTFQHLLSDVSEDLLLAAPFIKGSVTREITSELTRRGVRSDIRVTLLSNLRPECALNGSLDLAALTELGRSIPQFDLIHLPSLHAKVYIADSRMAIVTSGNLTDGGMRGNLEYGAVFLEESAVMEIRRDFENYSLLGAKVSLVDLGELAMEAAELKTLFDKAERTIRSQARRAFKEKLGATRVRLLQQQAKGKTTQGILCETILYLLSQRPLTTVEMHPLIQRLQPDLCDDSIDRVIDGVHFGKRWKHHVRTAQQYLKRTGRVRHDGTLWHLTIGMQHAAAE